MHVKVSVIVTIMYNFKKLVFDVTATEEHTIDWLKSKNLLKTQVDCSKYGTSANFVPKK